MESRAAFEIAIANLPPSGDRFYGPAGDAGLGAGMFLNNVAYPAYVPEHRRFGVRKGLVVVLTHECDLDAANDRAMNDSAIICPVIPLENFVSSLDGSLPDNEIRQLLSNVTARYVNRLVYLPLIPNILPFGGYLYLNLLSHTHITMLQAEDVQQICLASVDGLREIDIALERHLRRPKSDRLPFQR